MRFAFAVRARVNPGPLLGYPLSRREEPDDQGRDQWHNRRDRVLAG